MNDVEYLIGSPPIDTKPSRPFSDEICEFATALCAELMKSAKEFPDIGAFAFYCRKANVQRLKASFGDLQNRLGRGVCFHISPSNIPVNFAFSWLFSLFAGNSNIVRVPSRNFAQTDVICEALKKVLKNYKGIEKRNLFVRYASDLKTTKEFSLMSDARMIWGGDETIASIKAIRAKPRCIDIAFADRYSIAIINAESIVKSDEKTIAMLAKDFYNDTYLVDQNACSSPHLILWVNANETAKTRFWNAIFHYAQKRYKMQTAIAIDKYVRLCEDAIELDLHKAARHGFALYVVSLRSLPNEVERLREAGGYFYEYDLKNIEELEAFVTDKFQTLTYFGIEAETLRGFIVNNSLKGIDRIVPIGRALDMEIVWDGFNLIETLSRIVRAV
ncbi:MAG: acyl-CoA reductase [Helicobacteraceae bacterium]|jgi:hypothetical protein|nr:acyl-CoA reductase [Helicobacteraceae bacterium]